MSSYCRLYLWLHALLLCSSAAAKLFQPSPITPATTSTTSTTVTTAGEQDRGMFVIAPKQYPQQKSGWQAGKRRPEGAPQDSEQLYLPEASLQDKLQLSLGLGKKGRKVTKDISRTGERFTVDGMGNRNEQRALRPSWWANNLPKINIRCDPLINFKLKQRLMLLGACVTLGMDYISDIAQWRAYCAIEDTLVRGRFSLRGSELGWTKSWMLNLGLGEENAAKCKLRLGLNLKTYKLYAKMRFRTEPLSPFDIGEGLSCAGKLPLPLYVLPMLRSIPLRIEYRLRINTSKPSFAMRKSSAEKKVQLSTGLGAVDLSLDELNFCLEWDEQSPLWGIGIVKNEPSRRPAFSAKTAASRASSVFRGSPKSGAGLAAGGGGDSSPRFGQ